jgi:ATPase subunit of ABC transporter with duplicated ATPase domains
VLLSKTHLLLERNHRYGLIGQNGQGKTTLLNRVAAGDIKGFPTETSVYYIQHEILSEGFIAVKEFMMGQVPEGTQEDTIVKALLDVGFTHETMEKGVGELSGGWRMKLAIARSMLWDARILLLDEPTNHLDKAAVAWLVEKINSLVETTVLLVSHDYDFLKQVRFFSHRTKRVTSLINGPERRMPPARSLMV